VLLVWRQVSLAINTPVYYVLSEDNMFRLPSDHVQAIKVHKIKITIASLFLYGKIAISITGCYNAYVCIKC
jgi:hypothetical protein